MIRIVRFLFLFCCLIQALPAFAGDAFHLRTEKDLLSCQNRLLEKARRALQEPPVSRPVPSLSPHTAMSRILALSCQDPDLENLTLRTLAKETEEEDLFNGFYFESGYRLNEGGSDTTDRQSGYVGLAWEAFRGGYDEQCRKTRVKKLQRRLARLTDTGLPRLDSFRCRDTLLLHWFTEQRKPVAANLADLLACHLMMERHLYLTGDSYLDDVTKIALRKDRAESALRRYETLTASLPPARSSLRLPGLPPLAEIAIDRILEDIAADTRYRDIASLEQEILATRDAGFFRDTRLKLYVRTGADEDEDTGTFETGRFTAGVLFRHPLFRDRTHSHLVKSDQILREQAQRQEILLLDTWRRYNGYMEKYNDAVLLHHREMLTRERLRRQLIRWDTQKGNRSLKSIFSILADLLEIRHESMAVRESLYRRLTQLFSENGILYKKGYLTLKDPAAGKIRARSGSRTLYLWSGGVQNTPTPLLIAFCKAKGVERLLVSFQKKTDKTQFSRLVHGAKEAGITVVPMISDISWLFDENWPETRTRLKQICAIQPDLHLDIEPHQLADYKENPDRHQKDYRILLARIRDHQPVGATLSVSLPVWLPPEHTAAIAPFVDRIYCMAYGIPTAFRLVEKTRPFTAAANTTPVTIALRAKDFATELAMERYMDEITQIAGLQHFAIHQFREYQKRSGPSFSPAIP